MENLQVQKPRKLRWNCSASNLSLTACDPEQTLHGTDVTSFYTTLQNPQHAVQEPAVSLDAAIKSDNEGLLSRTTPGPGLPPTDLELFKIYASLRMYQTKSAREGEAQICLPNGKVDHQSCKMRASLCVSDWFWKGQRLLEEFFV